ncbi:SDR family oxidoreductase [candidate division KSB1 bacterium]|nr:SDR family oxidoreductase [candidate division KSB1 bacterium]
MRVLLTGHLGYIGTILAPMLRKSGHEVVGFDMNLYAQCTFGELSCNIDGIRKDIRDVQAHDLEGYDAIIHLAGLSNDPLGDLNPALTFEINHLASVNLARLAKKVGIKRFIFSSSCSNYGAAGDRLINEEGVLQPVTPYAKSKVLSEQDISRMADSSFTPTFLRSATAYGVSPRLRFDLVLNNLVSWAFTTGRIYLKSDGTPWRPIVHIEDISRAFVAVLEAPIEQIHNQAFNVGRTDENYQMKDLAEIVKDTVPNCEIEYAKNAGPDKRCYRVDCSKLAKKIPGFKPQWDARKGAKELYTHIQKYGLSLEDFEGPRYKRVAHLQQLLTKGYLDSSLRWRVLAVA